MSKLVKDSYNILQPILTQVADRCINQLSKISQKKLFPHSFEIEKAKKELIGLLVHIGSKPTEKLFLRTYISDLVSSHFLKSIHPVQLSMTTNSILDSLKEASKSEWTEQTERAWRQLFQDLSEIISEQYLQKNHAEFENDEHFLKSSDEFKNKNAF